jgi:aspartate kinase
VGKLSVVGAGISTNLQIVSLMFEALYDAGIDIQMISTSEIKASVLIDEKNLDKAANYVHDKFADEDI